MKIYAMKIAVEAAWAFENDLSYIITHSQKTKR